MNATVDFSEAERNMKAVIAQLTELTGFSREQVVIEEAGVILKTCASRSPVAKPAKTDLRSRLTAARDLGLTKGDITVNVGLRGPKGRAWARSKGPHGGQKNAGFRMLRGPGNLVGPALNYHWRREDWSEYQGKVADFKNTARRLMALGRQSAGLARQSWVQIADRLGIPLETVPGGGQLSPNQIAQARRATSSRGKFYMNGQAAKEKSAERFFVTLINNLPFGRRIRFDALLETVMTGRVKYFATSLSKGVFKSMKTVAERYKGFSATWITTG
jgi:hypothetical protein